MAGEKSINTIVLDSGSIIKNEPSASTLLSQAESIVTVPAILAEIKDVTTRARFETTLKPFVVLRSPRPASLQFVTDFARKTGDLAVLSKPDIQIIALTYELECERNGGDWRLRRVPGQKGMNGPPPKKSETEGQMSSMTPGEDVHNSSDTREESLDQQKTLDSSNQPQTSESLPDLNQQTTDVTSKSQDANTAIVKSVESILETTEIQELDSMLESASLTSKVPEDIESSTGQVDASHGEAEDRGALKSESEPESESDSEGWITPSNLKKKQAADASGSTKQAEEPKVMQVAVVTTDFAMQNVILQMNLNLLSPSLFRVKRLNTYVLRCHACFSVCKDLTKQFCPRCGQATLTRVACSTGANGEFKLHLKKNMQWNHRGDRYSVPKPVHGSSNGRIKGGGKGGWGNDLMLAEDQKEYQNASREQKRQKEKNLMDEDYLPGILTGDRGKGSGRIKVGAGRNVNAKKR